MAWMNQEKKKAILDSVKKLVKQHNPGIKVTASVRDYMSLTVRLKNDNLLKEDIEYHSARKAQAKDWVRMKFDQVLYFPRTLNPETLELYKKIEKAIHEVGGYYYNSDPTTDYFDAAFYYDCVVA